jgi:transcriptional regulator with XRE-family HTH domain
MPAEESPFWKLLFKLMTESGYTQKYVAEEIVVTTATLQYWRRNPTVTPEQHNLVALAELFKDSVTLDELTAAVIAGRGHAMPRALLRKVVDSYRKTPLGRDMPESVARKLYRASNTDPIFRGVHAMRAEVEGGARRRR